MSGNVSRKRNAFGLLMAKPSKSRFVPCPAGCGRHIPSCNVNRHLDECMSQVSSKLVATISQTQDNNSPKKPGPPPSSPDKARTRQRSGEDNSESNPDRRRKTCKSPNRHNENNSNGEVTPEQPTREPDTRSTTATKNVSNPVCSLSTGEDTSQPDSSVFQNSPDSTRLLGKESESSVFAQMMESSKVTFSTSRPVRQTLYLDSSLDARLLTDGDVPSEPILWSESIQLKKLSNKNHAPPVELTVCTSLPQAPQESAHRWVQKHSRLSVPVLKSILQKSIRRRRPLPAVRVSMELLDKAPGELFRRIPIIAVEDSTLHPDVPLLVCLMILHSKNFRIPPEAMHRVLEIVFEIASCPYKDNILADGWPEADETYSPSETDETLVWSLLARAEYGGMNGDVQMLQKYARTWQNRFNELVPCLPREQEGVQSWRELPRRLHETANAKVDNLIPKSITCLRMSDITVEGVDFHCSNILETLAKDVKLVDLCHDLLILSESAASPPEASEGRDSWINEEWKSIIWKCSAGVNHRRPLFPLLTNSAIAPPTSAMWTQLLATRVRAFQIKYVESRLSD